MLCNFSRKADFIAAALPPLAVSSARISRSMASGRSIWRYFREDRVSA